MFLLKDTTQWCHRLNLQPFCIKVKLSTTEPMHSLSGSLLKVESIADCSKGSILQYFLPKLTDNWSWKPIFGLFESDHFPQVLL